MTTSSSVSGSNTKKTNYWSSRRWLLFFGVALLGWTVLYLAAHSGLGIPGYERSGFSAADIRHVNSILINTTADDQPLSETRQQINNTNDGFLDTYPVDTTGREPYNEYYARNYQYTHTSPIEDKKERVRKAMVYIISQYGDAIDRDELANIQQYLTTFSPRETGIFLADYSLKVRSFFWLSGPMVYAEVICWVIFGVLCSLLFYIGNLVRKGNGNGTNQRNIIYHAARLFYAPFLAVMLVLTYSYLKGGPRLHIEASEVIIIFAFVLGFYSGLLQDLLDRLKGNNTATPAMNHSYEAPAAPPQQHAETKQAPPVLQPEAPAPQQEEETVVEELEAEEVPEPAQQFPPVQEVKQRRKVMNENNEITEVDIDLKLDFSGLFDEERMQLQRLGFNRAIVTLHNVNGKDIIPAKKLDDDMTTFVATDVKPGIYIARATLSQRLKDDQIINLFGEKTAYITEDKPGLELYVKKYEATD